MAIASPPRRQDPSFNPAAAKQAHDAALYVALKHKVRDAGLFKATPWFYVSQVVVLLSLIGGCMAVLIFSPSMALRLAMAPLMAGLLTHLSYIAHDAGHRQVFPGSPRANDVALLLLDPTVGLSPSWWMDAHNAHHSNPNDVIQDPNFRVPVLSFSKTQLREKSPFMRLICRFQAYYYVPLVMLETLNMRITSLTFLLKGGRYRRLELLGLATYFATYFGFLFAVLGFWEALLFAVLHQTLLGLYLGMVFAPNHKGMLVIEPGDDVGFLERQLVTTRNVRPGFLTDLMMGGLNYQVEHHLFPNIPRRRLGKARAIIKPFCEEHGLPYYEVSMLKSYVEVFRFFDTAGRDTTATVMIDPSPPHAAVALDA